jgi:hypothetical protein
LLRYVVWTCLGIGVLATAVIVYAAMHDAPVEWGSRAGLVALWTFVALVALGALFALTAALAGAQRVQRKITIAAKTGRFRMDWKRSIPLAVLAVSVLFLLLGAWRVVACQFSECYSGTGIPLNTAVELCGLGVAGLAFLAWLKR